MDFLSLILALPTFLLSGDSGSYWRDERTKLPPLHFAGAAARTPYSLQLLGNVEMCIASNFKNDQPGSVSIQSAAGGFGARRDTVQKQRNFGRKESRMTNIVGV
jgi:hypothetical protein